MRLLRSIARRPPTDTALVAHALTIHLLVALFLPVLGLRRLTACLTRASRAASRWRGEDSTVESRDDHVVWAVRTATHLVALRRTCLTEALTAQHLLRWRGGDATLRFGVAADPVKPFAAHAWLETAGGIIIGAETAAEYKPFAVPRR